MTVTFPLVAGGRSWQWQLRDRFGQWVEMGSEVKWLSRGRYLQGHVIDSPSPGMATVRTESGDDETVPASRLEVATMRVADAKRGDLIRAFGQYLRVTSVDQDTHEVLGVLLDPDRPEAEPLPGALQFRDDDNTGALKQTERVHLKSIPIAGTYDGDLADADAALAALRRKYPDGIEVALATATADGAFDSPEAQKILDDVEAVGARYMRAVDREARRRLYSGDLPEVEMPDRSTIKDDWYWERVVQDVESLRDAPYELLRAQVAREVVARTQPMATSHRQTWANRVVSPPGYGYQGPITPEVRDRLNSTLLAYPRSWVEALDRQPTYTTSLADRAYTIDSESHFGISGATAVLGGDTHRSVAHELAHGMEHAVPALTDLQGVFWTRRVGVSAMITEDTPLEDAGFYPIGTPTKPTARRYTLKRYKSDETFNQPGDVRPSGYEVLSTGVEEVLATGESGYANSEDHELWDFAMGALVTIGNTPPPVSAESGEAAPERTIKGYTSPGWGEPLSPSTAEVAGNPPNTGTLSIGTVTQTEKRLLPSSERSVGAEDPAAWATYPTEKIAAERSARLKGRQRASVTAAGDSWRWQLRDKNGKWIEMGAEVKWLARGLWREGIVIGSPSPGIATVREHLTQLIHQVPSNRLEVVRSAAEVLAKVQESSTGEGADWKKLGLTRYPALAEFVQRARAEAVPVSGWSSTGELVPDELGISAPTRVDAPSAAGHAYQSLNEAALSDPGVTIGGQEVIDRLRNLLPEYGFTDNQIVHLVESYARGEDDKRANLKLLQENPEDVRRRLEKFRDLRERGQVGIAVPAENARQILDTGRYKSQFETGSSSGLLSPTVRAEAETKLLGMLEDIPEEKRPVYGYLSTPDQMGADGPANYGSVRFVLKPEVRSRTTMTIGDSLGTRATPTSLEGDITDERLIESLASSYLVKRDESLTDFLRDSYVETQIRGGITNDDIERVVISAVADTWGDGPEINDWVIPAANRAGIPVEDLRPK